MDQIRKIRFLIPPFFFIASMLFVIYYSSPAREFLSTLKNFIDEKDSYKFLIAIFSAGAISILPIGFLIGSFSYAILRAIFFLFRSRGCKYEVCLNRDYLKRIWIKIGLRKPYYSFVEEQLDDLIYYATITFDHHILFKKRKGIHDWLVRRWNAFNISVHCISALILSYVLSWLLEAKMPSVWYTITLSIIIVLVINAVCTWRETMKMMDFQSKINPEVASFSKE